MTGNLQTPSSPQRTQLTAPARGSEVRAADVTAALVTLAGLAYATDSVLTTVRPALADASGAVTSACAVVEEVALIVSLLVQAGRS